MVRQFVHYEMRSASCTVVLSHEEDLMRRIVSILLLIAIILIPVGFYRGWFAFSTSRAPINNQVDLNLSVHPDKIEQDAELLKEKAQSAVQGVSR